MARKNAALVRRTDGWTNALTGIGSLSHDKRMATTMCADLITDEYAEALWTGSDLGKKFVECEADEMTRKGRDLVVKGEDDDEAAEIAEWVQGRREELGAAPSMNMGLKYRRAYGGGAVLIGVDDGQKPDQPVNFKRIRNVRYLNPIEKRRCWPVSFYADPLAARYGEVAVWKIWPEAVSYSAGSASGIDVHESRMLIFRPPVVSRQQMIRNNGWGDSGFVPVHRLLADFDGALGGVANLLTDYAQAVIKIKGLFQMLGMNQDDKVVSRVKLLNMSRSIARILVLDSDEEFKRETASLAGVKEILDFLAARVASAFGMPLTKFLGVSPGGLNATGAGEQNNWYDQCAASQQTDLKPQDDKLDKLLLCSIEGPTRGKEPEKWHGEYRPLYQMTELQQAELRNKQMLTDVGYIREGVVEPGEVTASRFGRSKWSPETVVDLEARAALARVKPEPPAPDDAEPVAPPKGKAPPKKDRRK